MGFCDEDEISVSGVTGNVLQVRNMKNWKVMGLLFGTLYVVKNLTAS
jgi:hypothetical protein